MPLSQPPKGVGFPDPLSGTLKSSSIGRQIIAPQRTNIAHLDRPRRASSQNLRQSTPWTAEGSDSALPFDGQAASGT